MSKAGTAKNAAILLKRKTGDCHMKHRIGRSVRQTAALLLALVLLISACPFAVFADEVSATTTEYVHLRKGQGTNTTSQGVLAKGTKVTVTDTSNKEWYAVRTSNGKTGYIYSKYLKLATASSSSSSSSGSTESTGDVGTAKTTTAVHLRTGRGTNTASKGVVASGTTVTVTDTSNKQWYGVRLANGKTGYIYAQYLKMVSTGPSSPSSTSSPSVTATPAPSTGETAASTVKAKTTAALNLRKGPGTKYGVVKVVAKNTTVTVIEATNKSWYKVKLSNGTTGYFSTSYLKITSGSLDSLKATPTPAPTAAPTAEPETTATSDPNATATPEPTATAEPTATPAPTPGVVKAQTTAAVNLRKGPGTSYSVIVVVAKNSTVTVTEVTNKDWYKVKTSNNKEGYISSQYLKITSGSLDSLKATATPTPTPTPTPSAPAAGTGEYVQTTTAVNLRSKASTSASVIRVLSSGTVVEVIDRKTKDWVHVRTSDKKEGYLYAQYTRSYDANSGSVTVSTNSASFSQYKTFYMQATTSGSVTWKSSNTDIATVTVGAANQIFIYGKAVGSTTVVAAAASGKTLATVKVTVTEPEAVRFAYSTPNIISAGEAFQLKAVTDPAKKGMKFEVSGIGTYETTTYKEETKDDNKVRIFSAPVTISAPGSYTVRAYSTTGSGYSTDYKEFTILVTSTLDYTTTSNESRLASDKMLEIIASFEGFVPTVYADKLAGNIPTVGYGKTVSKNTSFYNSLTKTEAWAMLADAANNGTYTTEVNLFIKNNALRMSQSQFDALVSFSYNIGSMYWNGSNSCYVRDIMLNTFAPPSDLSASKTIAAKTTKSVTVYSDHNTNKSVKTLNSGTAVTITEFWRESGNGWFKVTSGSTTGWVRSGDIKPNSFSGLTRDLAYVDNYTFCSNLVDWHVAGGSCLVGLYYRRLAEGKIFAYANYAEANKSNWSIYTKNTYGWKRPSCLF